MPADNADFGCTNAARATPRSAKTAFYACYGDMLSEACRQLRREAEIKKVDGWQTLQRDYWTESFRFSFVLHQFIMAHEVITTFDSQSQVQGLLSEAQSMSASAQVGIGCESSAFFAEPLRIQRERETKLLLELLLLKPRLLLLKPGLQQQNGNLRTSEAASVSMRVQAIY